MSRRDDVDVKTGDRLERLLDLARVGKHDVGVVLLGLFHDLAQIDLVVEMHAGCEVLTECVVAEQDLLFGAVRDHVVGPVNHGRVHERQGALADVQGFARLHR